MTTTDTDFPERREALMALPKHLLVNLYLEARRDELKARAKWRNYRNRYVTLRDAAQQAAQVDRSE